MGLSKNPMGSAFFYGPDTFASAGDRILWRKRWKIEAAFKELKQDVGSAETQTRHPNAVMNHLHFCMMATSVAWIYAPAEKLGKRQTGGTRLKAVTISPFPMFEDRLLEPALDDNFGILFPVPRKSVVNSLVAVLIFRKYPPPKFH